MEILLGSSYLFLLAIFFIRSGSIPQKATGEAVVSITAKSGKERKVLNIDSLVYYAQKFHSLNTQVRDGRITELKAKKEVSRLLPLIKRYYLNSKNTEAAPKKFFPVSGYSQQAIGGTNGSGYLPKSYNYYQGNLHKGHPAHDIFVQDKNLDCLDDKTGKPIKIISVTQGVVIAAEPKWEPKSVLRGGKYLWVYNPKEEILYYYAHNQELMANPGDLVKAGQIIATMGRTGLNAYKKRSPTHLHFMTLKVKSTGELPAIDLYNVLVKLK